MVDDDYFEELERLLSVSGAQILAGATARDFLAWFQEGTSMLAPNFHEKLGATRTGNPIFQFGVGLWNRFPQPENNWQPLPLAEPAPWEPCLCSSGKQFRDCCSNLPNPDVILDRINLLKYVLECAPLTLLKRTDASHMEPYSLTDTCHHWIANNETNKVQLLLEPLFRVGRPSPEHAGLLLDTLLDAWPSWQRPRKRMSLLNSQIESANDDVATVALQCKVSVLADQNRREEAWSLFRDGLRRFPDDVNFAALEITLLMSEGRMEEARLRTEFWSRMMARRSGDFSDYIHRLQMLVDQKGDETFLDELADSDPALGQLITALRDTTLNLDIFDVTLVDHMLSFEITESSACLLPEEAESLDGLIELCLQKPLLLSNTSFLRMLSDSIQVTAGNELAMGSLCSLIYNRAEWLLFHLLKNSADATDSHVGESPDWAPLIQSGLPEVPWVMIENRPILSMIDRQIEQLTSNFWGDDTRHIMLMQLMVCLNPADNHGYRTPLSNELLKKGEAEKVLALLKDYEDDFAPVRMNRVLALWLTDKKKQAAEALSSGGFEIHEIRRAITNKRYARPKDADSPFISPGGKNEAWHYRNEMQSLWQEVGAIAWLKSQPLN